MAEPGREGPGFRSRRPCRQGGRRLCFVRRRSWSLTRDEGEMSHHPFSWYPACNRRFTSPSTGAFFTLARPASLGRTLGSGIIREEAWAWTQADRVALVARRAACSSRPRRAHWPLLPASRATWQVPAREQWLLAGWLSKLPTEAGPLSSLISGGRARAPRDPCTASRVIHQEGMWRRAASVGKLTCWG